MVIIVLHSYSTVNYMSHLEILFEILFFINTYFNYAIKITCDCYSSLHFLELNLVELFSINNRLKKRFRKIINFSVIKFE